MIRVAVGILLDDLVADAFVELGEDVVPTKRRSCASATCLRSTG